MSEKNRLVGVFGFCLQFKLEALMCLGCGILTGFLEYPGYLAKAMGKYLRYMPTKLWISHSFTYLSMLYAYCQREDPSEKVWRTGARLSCSSSALPR
jgi:hypothetical protein